MTYPSGKFETYSYDNEGNLSSKVDRNLVTTTYEYNSLGNVTLEKATKGIKKQQKSYEYATTGAMIRAVNENVDISYKYNDKGLINSETYKIGDCYYYKWYKYDTNGNVSRFVFKQGAVKGINYFRDEHLKTDISYEYDSRNRMIAVKDRIDGVDIAKYTYDVNGNVSSTTYGNGVVTSYTYNNANLVKELVNKKGSSVLSSYNYEYNYDGNQIKKSDNKGNVTQYSYDGLGRLSEENESSVKRGTTIKSYSYDYSGNREKMTVTGSENFTTSYSYDVDNRLQKETKTFADGNINVFEYKYDENGNQIRKIESKSNVKFGGPASIGIKTEEELETQYETRTYDFFNQLTGVKDRKMTSSYTYMPDGLRLSKTVNGVKTGFVWYGSQLLEEYDSSGNVLNVYNYGLGRIRDTADNYYLYNAHGDVTGITNGSGTVTKEYEYDAFGVEVNKDEKDKNPWRYCGEYFDEETDNIYYGTGYYMPLINVFTSKYIYRNILNLYTCVSIKTDVISSYFGPNFQNYSKEKIYSSDSYVSESKNYNIFFNITKSQQKNDNICWAHVSVELAVNAFNLKFGENETNALKYLAVTYADKMLKDAGWEGGWNQGYSVKYKANPETNSLISLDGKNITPKNIYKFMSEYNTPLVANYYLVNENGERIKNSNHVILITGISKKGNKYNIYTLNSVGKIKGSEKRQISDFLTSASTNGAEAKIEKIYVPQADEIIKEIYNTGYANYSVEAQKLIEEDLQIEE